MKQKNLAMLGVAVGCGLVAAVAVAKLSAGGTKQPDSAKVLVAKKDLPVQTTLDEKEIDNLLVWADMPKNLVPPDACTDLEQVKGKSLGRTLRQGNPVSVSDLTVLRNLVLPDGCKALTVKCTPVDAVAGFAKPGSKVDIMYVEKTGTGKTRAAIILKDMLLLALNTANTVDEKTGAAIPQVESATLAVNNKQATLITLADERGKLKLILRDKNKEDTEKPVAEGEIEWLDDPFAEKAPPLVAPVASPKMDTAVVARKPVPVNTLINADNVGEFFTTVELKTAPEGVVTNADDLKGKFVVKAVNEGQFLYKTLTASEVAKIEKPETKPETVPTPMVNPTPTKPEKTEVAEKDKKKLPRFEQIIQEGGQARRVIWLEVAPEKWKRFESGKEADAFNPDADDPKKHDKDKDKDGQKADQ
jgi:pilus assembly protein CpaB